MSGACNFIVRHWQPEDSEPLAKVFARAVRQTASRDYRPAQIEAWVGGSANWTERMDTRVTFVAAEAGRPIGFIQYDLPDRIDMAYVDPLRQRLGVGAALLAALEAEAKNRKARLLTVEASITGRPFFEACGFELLTPQIVRVRGQEFLNYRMQKILK